MSPQLFTLSLFAVMAAWFVITEAIKAWKRKQHRLRMKAWDEQRRKIRDFLAHGSNRSAP